MSRKPSDYSPFYTSGILYKLQTEFHKAYLSQDCNSMKLIIESLVTELPNTIKPKAKDIMRITNINISRVIKATDNAKDMPKQRKTDFQRAEISKLWLETKDSIMQLLDNEGILVSDIKGIAGVHM